MKHNILIWFLVLIFVASISVGGLSAHPEFESNTYQEANYPEFVEKDKTVALEIFTATWCGWCHKAYELYDHLESKFGKLSVSNIRYHCQDKISIETIKDRTNFYGISGFPTIISNGTYKQTGVNDDIYDKFEKLVKDELNTPSELAIHTNVYLDNNKINLDVFLQAQKKQLEGEFLTLTMVSGLQEQNSSYDYVAETVFPSFDGLHLVLNPGEILHLAFTMPMDQSMGAEHYSTLCMFQNMKTKEVYNSQYTSLYSLVPISFDIESFQNEVSRDHAFKIQFTDGLIVNTIKTNQFYFQDSVGKITNCRWEYNSSYKELVISPESLLEPNMGYVLCISGGDSSFVSTKRQTLFRDIKIPFVTSEKPDLNLQYSESRINFGDVMIIDSPFSVINIKEANGNNVKLEIESGARWIECSPEKVTASESEISISINPLFMVVGKNTGFVKISSIAGEYIIHVEANRLSNKYPSIRIDPYSLITFEKNVSFSGRTDGYKVHVSGKEIEVDLDGKFSFDKELHPGTNYVTVESKNMRGKVSVYPVVIVYIEVN
ncbi:MAG: hypothetical protein KAH01_03445 [Caldisericia bacterium]|nr:hypothetical protein [Caldisericia bacterium]